MNRWSVCKRDGQWRVVDDGIWHDTCDTLAEAHTYATQLAVADVLFDDGGLTHLRALQLSSQALRHLLCALESGDLTDWLDWIGWNDGYQQNRQELLSTP